MRSRTFTPEFDTLPIPLKANIFVSSLTRTRRCGSRFSADTSIVGCSSQGRIEIEARKRAVTTRLQLSFTRIF
ncbi:hypothetical protein SCLCIDRAFT_1086874 [Scleroderma citrinum Foug A]|uniref:Uncharacterized protein n=1 Tax=Scleroderma citrinum Foug A TaxID=1036808 RepID=A0A0C3DCX9_9AGAM|nr:hypothetical protein SCLCIDRAFT_1086874 [Scleroderma citrinum Foug A]